MGRLRACMRARKPAAASATALKPKESMRASETYEAAHVHVAMHASSAVPMRGRCYTLAAIQLLASVEDPSLEMTGCGRRGRTRRVVAAGASRGIVLAVLNVVDHYTEPAVGIRGAVVIVAALCGRLALTHIGEDGGSHVGYGREGRRRLAYGDREGGGCAGDGRHRRDVQLRDHGHHRRASIVEEICAGGVGLVGGHVAGARAGACMHADTACACMCALGQARQQEHAASTCLGHATSWPARKTNAGRCHGHAVTNDSGESEAGN